MTSVQADGELLSVARGASVVAAGRVFSYAIRLVMAALLARWLGADDYGLYILVVSVAFAASGVASLGLHTAMERHVAVRVRRGDLSGVRGGLQVGFVGTMTSGLLVAAVLAVFADPIARDVFDEPRLVPLIHVSAVAAPVLALQTLLISSVRGFKRMDQATVAEDIVQPVIRFLLLLSLAVFGMTSFRAGVAFGLSYGASIVLLVYFVHRRLPLHVGVRDARRDVREITAFSFPFWFAGVLRVVRTRLQPLLLGVFGSTANVGVFSVVTSANALGRVANASIRDALRPTLAELHDAGDTEQLGRLYATTTRWTMAANLPVFLVMVLVPESLLAIFGADFQAGATALRIVAFAELANAATGMCGPVISMSSHNKMKMANSVVWMVTAIAANVVLIPIWGVIGAAIAVLISTTTINVVRVVELWVLLRILPWDRRSWKPIVAAAVTSGLGLLALELLPDVLGIGLLLAVSTGLGAVFLALFVAFGLDPDDRLVVTRVSEKLRSAGRKGSTKPAASRKS